MISSSKLRQSLSIPGKPAANVVGGQVRKVEVDARVLSLGHLRGDRQRNDVAGRELGQRVATHHEALAVDVAQVGPFPAQGFGEEMTG